MPDFRNISAASAVVNIIGNTASLNEALEQAGSSLQAFGNICNDLGKRMMALGSIITEPFKAAALTFSDFDQKMRTVQAVTNSSGDAFDKLKERAKQLGATTTFTAGQVADGMAALGRMGFNPDQIDAAIKGMMDLSIATGTELSTASEIAANQMSVFGLSASQMTQIADILAMTANASAQNLGDLGEALKTAGPVAARTGQTLEQVAAQLGVLANMGIRGSMAGTALARSYKQLADPQVQKYLKETLGVQVTQDGKLRDMATVFAEIGKALSGMPEATRLNAMEEIFQAAGSLGGGSLSIDAEAIDAFMEKLKQSGGYAEEASGKMQSGLKGALESISSAFEGVRIAIGEAMEGPLTTVLNLVTKASLFFVEFIGNNQMLIVTLGAMSGIVTVVATGLIAISTAIASAKTIETGWIAVKALLNNAILQHCTALKAEIVTIWSGTAAEAKKVIVDKIAAASTALKTAWTAKAAIVEKLQTACTLSNISAQAKLAVTNALLSIKTAIATASTAAFGVAAKLAATGVTILTSALTTLASHPFLIALMAISVICLDIYRNLKAAREERERLMRTPIDEAKQRTEETRYRQEIVVRNEEQSLMRMQQLSTKGTLNNEELEEALRLSQELAEKGYANLPRIDLSTGKISEMTKEDMDAAEETLFKHKAAILETELANMANTAAKYERAMQQAVSAGNMDLYHTLQQEMNLLNQERRQKEAELKDMAVQRERQKAQEASTKLEEKRQKAQEASTRLAEMEKEMAEARLTSIERELAAIADKRKQYKELLQAQLDFEKAKANVDKEKVAELQEKLKEADATFNAMEQDAMDKHYAENSHNMAEKYRGDTASQLDEREKWLRGRNLEDLKATSSQSYIEKLKALYLQAGINMQSMAKKYQDLLISSKSKDSAGGEAITEEEKMALNEQMKKYEKARSDLSELENRLRSGAEEANVQEQQFNAKSKGSFIAAAFAMMGGDNIDKRTEKNTSNIAKSTSDIYRWLQNNDFGSSFA